jgi:hypothetical protein
VANLDAADDRINAVALALTPGRGAAQYIEV